MTTSEQPGLVALQERIAELEFKLAYQENTLESLEKTSAYQQQSIQSLERKLSLLGEYLKSLREEPIKPLSEETPPPHY
ncbi:SlyX family protein [Thiomicrospira sp.]|uniref:SlyX family protein n=1 Tax=Thiomicrospira sp. TaxID=935 RepID=UPI002F94ED6C